MVWVEGLVVLPSSSSSSSTVRKCTRPSFEVFGGVRVKFYEQLKIDLELARTVTLTTGVNDEIEWTRTSVVTGPDDYERYALLPYDIIITVPHFLEMSIIIRGVTKLRLQSFHNSKATVYGLELNKLNYEIHCCTLNSVKMFGKVCGIIKRLQVEEYVFEPEEQVTEWEEIVEDAILIN